MGFVGDVMPRMERSRLLIIEDPDPNDGVREYRFANPYHRDVCISECLSACEHILHMPKNVLSKLDSNKLEFVYMARNRIAHCYHDPLLVSDNMVHELMNIIIPSLAEDIWLIIETDHMAPTDMTPTKVHRNHWLSRLGPSYR